MLGNLSFLVIGLFLGALVVWLFFRIKSSSSFVSNEKFVEVKKMLDESVTQLTVTQDRLSRSEEFVKSGQQEISQLRDTYSTTRDRSIELDNENKHLKDSLEKQKLELENIGKKFSNEFEILANKILEDKSQRFTKINQENIDQLLKPLGVKIEDFQKLVKDAYDKESKERFSLGNEVKQLRELNQTISQEAKNLTEALKGQAKTQGNWGEMILESILEKSGLVKGREYTVQESVKDSDGKRFQPDVILTYPDKGKVVIDSKVSLVAYERYSSSSNKEDQDKALSEHLRSIRTHIDSLSSKNYQDLVGSLEWVMMFIPIEPAYMVVMEADSELWNYAYSRRVLLISPTNLIAALKMIHNLWRHEYQNRNAIEIAEKGGRLYDKFVGFVENLQTVGESIHKAHQSYESAFNQLKDGRGNLISQAQQLKELGVKAKKTIPSELIDGADVNTLNAQDQLPSNE
jgi:DNA recombination protein RmuC